jgi:hypothetical protein
VPQQVASISLRPNGPCTEINGVGWLGVPSGERRRGCTVNNRSWVEKRPEPEVAFAGDVLRGRLYERGCTANRRSPRRGLRPSASQRWWCGDRECTATKIGRILNMDTLNPYLPPTSPSPVTNLGLARRYLNYLISAMLSVGLTLLLWVAIASIVSTFDRSVGNHFIMLLWAFTLFLSSSISTAAICWLWGTKTHPLAFGGAFSIFSIAFVLLEGDTSNGTDSFQMTIIYGTLTALPVFIFLFARWAARHLCAVPQVEALETNKLHGRERPHNA